MAEGGESGVPGEPGPGNHGEYGEHGEGEAAAAPKAAADVRALLECGVPLERVCGLRPHSLTEPQIRQLAKDWLTASDHVPEHALEVARAVLLRGSSALQDSGFRDRLLEGLDGDAPEELRDPLVYTLMRDPVVLSSGVVLDRSTALNDAGLLRFHECPFTRQPLNAHVYPLLFLKDRLVDFVRGRLSQIFSVLESAVAGKPGDDFALAARAIEIGRALLKDVGRSTFTHEAETMYRWRLRLLHASQQRDVGLWQEAFCDLCTAARDPVRAEVLQAALAELLAMAEASLAPEPPAEPEPERAVALLQAACAVAHATGPAVAGAVAGAQPAPQTVIAMARLLLRAARAPTEGVRTGQALTAVYLALSADGAGDNELGAFLDREGLRQEDLEFLLRPPTTLRVLRMASDRSTDGWHRLGLLQCPSGVVLLRARCQWRDQGWGNKKGRIRAVLARGEARLYLEDLFGLCGDPDRPDRSSYALAERALDAPHPLLALARPGDAFLFEYFVGGGGGHQITIQDFVAEAVAGPMPGSAAANAAGSHDGQFNFQIEMPPAWFAPLLGRGQGSSEVEFMDNDGDHIAFKLENFKLVKYVNGIKKVGRSDSSGIVTRLRLSGIPRGPWGGRLDDQEGWGGLISAESLTSLRALAGRAGVPIDLSDLVGGGSDSDSALEL